MNRGLSPVAFLLIIALVLGGVYFYNTASAVCDVPIAYRIGVLAPQFGLTEEEARAAVTEAESIWEDATGLNLFSYDAGGELAVNFIYDERQAETNAELVLREQLEERQHLTEEIKAQYDLLSAKYDELKASYDRKVAAYEERLAAHNAEVQRWNESGGAPAEIFKQLEDQQSELQREQRNINRTAGELNELAQDINELGERGNVIVSAYNNVVDRYNDRFHNDGEEFTQGDYQGTSINIYQYENHEELVTVLAHELGHALSLDHVEGEASFMYRLMGGQSLGSGLSPEDMAEFKRVCKTA
jgi:DNA repair exonuclease SbcCD ATPase subunit